MKCAICNEETIGTNAKMWGCDFAHVTCIKAYSLGKNDTRAITDGSVYFPTEESCRKAFQEEDGCGDPDTNPTAYRKFRDGFFAANTLRAAVEAAQPEAVGWKLVPIEPTPAMLVAMWDHREAMRGQSENRIARAGYDAMLASAPTEPMSAPTAEPVQDYHHAGKRLWCGCIPCEQKWKALIDGGATPPSAATPEPSDADAQPRLTVRVTSYPESNGKRNWTAMLVRVDPWDGLIGNCGGITIDRGELWNRVAYEAECARFLLGERDTQPHILDYGDDIETPEGWAGETRGGWLATKGGKL